jgi:RNA polymerase sigma factor (sigma-70 family)
MQQQSRAFACGRLQQVPRMDDQVANFQLWIDRLNAGDGAARAELVKSAYPRLLEVVGKRLNHFARVARWEQVEDVTQEAALKLWGALKDISPRTVGEFWVMAGEHVRRVLLDLIRHHFGPQRLAAYTEIRLGAAPEPVDARIDPANLDRWTALHEQIDQLPQEERSIVMAVWYGGLSLAAAARVFGISPDTAQRRWKAARVRLRHVLKGERPD